MPDAVAPPSTALDQLCINTLRTLAMDAVQRANSGHPGTPMALAPLGYLLWTKHLRGWGPYDLCLAAATVLATGNTREFHRVPGLAVENGRTQRKDKYRAGGHYAELAFVSERVK